MNYVRDWTELPIGARFIEDTFNEIYEVIETGCYPAPVSTDVNNPETRTGVKAVVVGYQTGDKEPPESQEGEVFNYDLDWGQPVIRLG